MKGNSPNKQEYLIFLAEDDVDDQEMLVEAMNMLEVPLAFSIANTGSRALEILQGTPDTAIPDLIILDYNLPEVSGAEILTRLKQMKLFEAVPKVIWSTSNSPVYQKKCMENGALSYVVKPVGIAGIRSIARQLVDLCIRKP